MPKIFRRLFVFLTVLVCFLIFAAPATAHRLILEQDGNVLRARYDDRTPARSANVRLLDEGGRVLWEGLADENGELIPPIQNFEKAQADDGLGHRATFVPGQEQQEIPRFLGAALGVSFFLFVASLGNYLSKKKT